MRYVLGTLLMLLILFILHIKTIYAQSDLLEITSLMIDPNGPDFGEEWIELQNSSDQVLQTDDYEIQIDLNLISVFNYCDEIIGGETCRINFGGRILHNDFGLISLLHDGEIIQNTEYEETLEGKVYKIIDGLWQFVDEDNFGINIEGLLFSEIYPSPESGEEEWLELYNPLDFSISSNLFSIHRDSCLTSSIIKSTLDLEILPDSVAIIPESFLNKKLLNSGGILVLCDLVGNTVDLVTYPAITNGSSYSRVFENNNPTDFWLVNEIPSKEELNTIVGNNEIEEEVNDVKTIREVRAYANETDVYISGIVTAIFNNKYFYVQDLTSGIWIDIRFDEAVDVSLGDEYEINGVVSTTHAERKIRVNNLTDIKIKGQDKAIPNFININSKNSIHEYEGMLVQFEGKVEAKFSKSFDITDELQTIRASVFDTGLIDISDVVKNSDINVVGILSRQDEDFRILPRKQADILATTVSKVAEINEELIEEDGDILGEKSNITSAISKPEETYFPLPSLDINKYEPPQLDSNTEIFKKLQIGILTSVVVLALFFLYINQNLLKSFWVKFTDEFKQFSPPQEYIPIHRKSGGGGQVSS